MFAFLDIEFTDLVIRPRLLSMGLVPERVADLGFYGGVTFAQEPERAPQGQLHLVCCHG
jgi:hypothetical protein